MIVPFFFTHSRILFSFFLFFAVRNDSEVRIEFSSKSNESIYIYTRIGRRTRVCTIRRNAHVDTEKEGGKLVGRWSPINLVIPNWECKIHAVRICASVRRDLSVRRSRWAGTASNLFVCFMDSGPDSAAAVLIRFPIFAGAGTPLLYFNNLPMIYTTFPAWSRRGRYRRAAKAVVGGGGGGGATRPIRRYINKPTGSRHRNPVNWMLISRLDS